MTAAREEIVVRSTGRLLSGAVGPRGVALLRRIRAAGGAYRCERNADRDAAERCAVARYLHIDRRDKDLLHITDDGVAFLDSLMRAH